MDKITKKDVETATEELKLSLLEAIELDEKMLDIKLRQAKAHKRLQLARDIISNIRIN
jgi:hypothetical protein